MIWLIFFIGFYATFVRTNAFFEIPKQLPSFNPLNMMFVNKCMEDLGCFYNGAPFFHPVFRPLSLAPVENPKPKFLLFTRTNPIVAYFLEITEDSLKNSPFNPDEGSKFLIHGFYFPVTPDDIRHKTKDALLEKGEYNVFIVDWSEYNGVPYAQATANTRVIGAVIAKLIHFLIAKTGVSSESFHLIGHSLGAHTAGYVGERVPNLGRITGLDPAGPFFQKMAPEVRLDPTDALFVDVIHTDGAEIILLGLGMNDPVGHVDFYPNGGSLQLGCVQTSNDDSMQGALTNITAFFLFNGCDHERSTIYFYESVISHCGFEAQICDDYSSYEEGKCKNTKVTDHMGLKAQMLPGLKIPAKFFLRTNGNSPFCIN